MAWAAERFGIQIGKARQGWRGALAFASGFADAAFETAVDNAFGHGCVSVGRGSNYGVSRLVDCLLMGLIRLLLEFGFSWKQADPILS